MERQREPSFAPGPLQRGESDRSSCFSKSTDRRTAVREKHSAFMSRRILLFSVHNFTKNSLALPIFNIPKNKYKYTLVTCTSSQALRNVPNALSSVGDWAVPVSTATRQNRCMISEHTAVNIRRISRPSNKAEGMFLIHEIKGMTNKPFMTRSEETIAVTELPLGLLADIVEGPGWKRPASRRQRQAQQSRYHETLLKFPW